MQTDPQVTFRDLPADDAIERECLNEIAKLERYYDRITSCRVVVSPPPRRHEKGELFEIRIDLVVPGDELFVHREPPLERPHEDFLVAVTDAFDKAKRQLQDYARKQSGDVKEHHPTPEGRVARMLNGYGFIEAADGHEVYFHEHSVRSGDFSKLDVGSRVHFGEELGDKGPQAKWVRPVGRS